MILHYNGKKPVLGRNIFIANNATVIGDVNIDDYSSVWFNSVVRGDVNHIIVGKYSNIQDNSVLHVRKDTHPLIIGDKVTIGHGVVAHGCIIEDNTLIGIGSILLDGAVIGKNSIVGAGSMVPPSFVVPSGKLVIGSPCEIYRDLTDSEIEYITELSSRYTSYSQSYIESFQSL